MQGCDRPIARDGEITRNAPASEPDFRLLEGEEARLDAQHELPAVEGELGRDRQFLDLDPDIAGKRRRLGRGKGRRRPARCSGSAPRRIGIAERHGGEPAPVEIIRLELPRDARLLIEMNGGFAGYRGEFHAFGADLRTRLGEQDALGRGDQPAGDLRLRILRHERLVGADDVAETRDIRRR